MWGTLAILDYGSEPFVFEERKKIPLGADFALRRALIEHIGDFDPNLGRNAESLLLGQELPEFFARTRAIGAIGLYVPAMRVEHHVPARRLQPAYVRRWWYGKGISRARTEAVHPITELGLDMRHVPTIAGIPRFLFGSAARDAIRWINALLRGDRGDRFAAETQLWYFYGQVGVGTTPPTENDVSIAAGRRVAMDAGDRPALRRREIGSAACGSGPNHARLRYREIIDRNSRLVPPMRGRAVLGTPAFVHKECVAEIVRWAPNAARRRSRDASFHECHARYSLSYIGVRALLLLQKSA